jgi:ABC-type nitrate/sulfonate/bicarbonate transport system substrate-binding protein
MPGRITKKRRGLALLAALLTASLAAACSSSSSGTSPAGSGTASASGTASLSLSYGQVSNSIAFFPVYVAQHEGYFAAEHLTVGPNPFPVLGTGAKVAAALAGGSIDVGGSVMTDAFNLSKANQSPEVIGALVDAYYIDIVVGKNTRVAPAGDSLVDKVKSLKGLKIGITGPGSGTSALITYLFNLAGLNPQTDVTMVNLGGNSTAALDALKSGQVDAVSYAQPLGQEATLSGVGSIYISPSRGDIPALAGDVQGVIFTNSAVLGKKQQAIQAFVAGVAKAEELIHTASAATVGALLKDYLPTLTPTMVAAVIPLLHAEMPATPAISSQEYQVASSFHKSTGLFPDPPAYGSIIDSALISAAISQAGS